MTRPSITKIQQALAGTAGGFLRNPVQRGTCTRCFTPIASPPLCSRCHHLLSFSGGPDLLGVMAYAGYIDPISQSGHLMRGYKNPHILSGVHHQTVALMAALGLMGHVQCPGRLLGAPVSAWTTVASLPPKPGQTQHTLNGIVGGLARHGAVEVVLTAADTAPYPREVSRTHYTSSPNASGQHVLIIDDTWTGGGHATSAALAVRDAGATRVSVLALARWLSSGWELTTPQWAKQELSRPDFNPAVCPWTQGTCP